MAGRKRKKLKLSVPQLPKDKTLECSDCNAKFVSVSPKQPVVATTMSDFVLKNLMYFECFNQTIILIWMMIIKDAFYYYY